MERRPSFDWKSHTPAELVNAVSHLRNLYDDAQWKIDEVTRNLCFAKLHPADTVKDLIDYERAFERIKPSVGVSRLAQFRDLYSNETYPASYAAFFSMRGFLLRNQVLGVLQELLSISTAQRHLLSTFPSSWVISQVQTLIDEEVWRTPRWIKRVCDIQPVGLDDPEMDEAIHWRKWRAPLFLVMKPSKQVLYDPERVWERQDEEKTLKWLDLFTQEVIRDLEGALQHAVGQAHLAELKTVSLEPMAATATSNSIRTEAVVDPMDSGRVEFSHSDDYQSIKYDGQTHTLTARQAKLVQLLHEAFLSGHPNVPKARLLAKIEAETSQVRDVFKDSPLWKTLIRPVGRRGFYRFCLDTPEAE